jgi:hypothetical protein
MKLNWSFLVCLFVLAATVGCGKVYEPVASDNLKQGRLENYEGRRISIVGVPGASERKDFLSPTPWREGEWAIVVNDVSCNETVNFENEPRIRTMLQIADAARKEKRPVKVSGVVKEGRLQMEYFEDIRTDTPWFKNKSPYYSYGEYYDWYPFAYSPNVKTLKVVAQ